VNHEWYQADRDQESPQAQQAQRHREAQSKSPRAIRPKPRPGPTRPSRATTLAADESHASLAHLLQLDLRVAPIADGTRPNQLVLMSSSRIHTRFARTALTASAFALAVAAGPGEAHAEGPVSGDGKGIVGGALLGAEVVTITMGIIGVEAGWPYFVFGAVGAGAGGVGGFLVENSNPPAEAPLYMLAGGMALVIPALVVALDATSYRPPAPGESDADEPVDNNPEAPGGEASFEITSEVQQPHGMQVGAIDLSKGRLRIGAPAVDVRPTYSAEELATFGVEQDTEVQFPIVRATF